MITAEEKDKLFNVSSVLLRKDKFAASVPVMHPGSVFFAYRFREHLVIYRKRSVIFREHSVNFVTCPTTRGDP
jgi:hypothetical protein